MSDEIIEEETTEERLKLDIEVIVQEGEVTEVIYKGQNVHALVRDYDVEFPCAANNIGQDEDGDYYMEIII